MTIPEKKLLVSIVGASGTDAKSLSGFLESFQPDSEKCVVVFIDADGYEDAETFVRDQLSTPVKEIISTVDIRPGYVHLIPANNTVVYADGALKLQRLTRGDANRSALDTCYASFAEAYGPAAVGILLSGTGGDGISGLKRIKEKGGAVIIQRPDTAKYKARLSDALHDRIFDFITPPSEIPRNLISLEAAYEACKTFGPAPPTPAEIGYVSQILWLVFVRLGVDFREYDQVTMRRRIAHRMAATGNHTLADYHAVLKADPIEQEELYDALLARQSYFFGDFRRFDDLIAGFSKLFNDGNKQTLRIWVIGCSTGQEAYSFAIAAREYCKSHDIGCKVQVFATDMSSTAVDVARTGLYLSGELADVPKNLRETYFTKKTRHYQINNEIREMCIFSTHDIVKDPPFSKIDLAACSTFYQMMGKELTEKVWRTIHYSLDLNGILSIADSPNTNFSEFFAKSADTKTLYKPKNVAKTLSPRTELLHRIGKLPVFDASMTKKSSSPSSLFLSHAPAGVVINAQGEIIHFNGDTSPYLHPSTGKPTFHIFRMARPFLEYGIRQPVQEALETGMPTRVVLREEDGKPVMVEVIPAEENFLVLFRENHFAEAESYQDQGANWLQMQKEMKRWRDDIITVTEEREVAFEELQSTHEELISRTEEMQLANEELESATESLHSTNEELRTMNEELQNRQQQIIVQRNFSDAIIATMHEPIAVIDEGFAILRVNPAFCRYVNLSENRVLGESLHDIAGLDRQEISPLLNTVFKEGIVLDGCQLEGSFAFGKRSLLLNASVIANASPKAVLIAFKDMSETMNAYRLLEAKNRELEIYNRELWMFGSAANHDLQEPLRKTLMFARRMLDDESIGNASRHFLERIISVTENMQNLVSDTIDYMQSSPEKKFRNTDLSHVARQSYAELEDVIAARSATVTIGPLPHSLVLPSQIKHLFTSLIMNAISYGLPNVPPEVVIGVEEIKLGELPEISGSENKFCKVRIADNGQGFDKDKADRIFEPFYRLHSKDAIPGNGLGLTICKKIMINHNGFIKACGRKNGGCTIDLYFPLAEK